MDGEESIDLDIEMDEVEYCGYEGFMMHVWTNLIDNAIKFDSYGGSIRLRLKKDGERVRFTVRHRPRHCTKRAEQDIHKSFIRWTARTRRRATASVLRW